MIISIMKRIKCILQSSSAKHTELLAENFAQNIGGGEVIQLISDLGGGKTTFTRGFARGLNSQDVVSSPTFTISNEYQSSKFIIYHFDFYRLQDPGVVANELNEAIKDSGSVVIVEWADIVQNVLPEETIKIHFKPSGNNSRTLEISVPASKLYAIEGLL